MSIIDRIDKEWKIDSIEWATLPGTRARSAGCNARLKEHGNSVPHPIVRITIAGEEGFGWSVITKEQASEYMNVPVIEMFAEDGTVLTEYRKIEYGLLDWLGRLSDKPVYELFSKQSLPHDFQLKVSCYDTSLYFDDLHLETDAEAVQLIQQQVADGMKRGHVNFKIKVGRGAMHMPLEQGIRRDIAIIKGVRAMAGDHARIMIDANNGYNLNITKQVLKETAGERLFWIEEAFHEDPVLYANLKSWIQEQGLHVLIADGEGVAAPPLVEWAKQGVVDVIQYDIRHPGFSFWIELGRELDALGIKTAPHNYGTSYGNYITGHLACAVDGLLLVEWDEIEVMGLDRSNYTVEEGYVIIPNKSGFGLNLDHSLFFQMVSSDGWRL